MARSWLARLASRAVFGTAEPFAPRGALRHSTSSGSSGGGAAAPATAKQAPPAALGPIAQLQREQLRGAHAAPGTLGKPVVMPVGALVLTGAALLGGGMVLGALTEKLHQQSEAPQQANSSSSSGSSRGGGSLSANAGSRGGSPVADAGGSSQAWPHLSLADYIPSFMSHSQARSAAVAASGATAADARSSAGGAAPLGGCLSPYFISDATAKAAPAVVNITVQASGALPVGSSGSGFIVDADGTILTNAHVVSDAIQRHYYGGGGGSGSGSGSGGGSSSGGPGSKGITVTLQDGRIFEGRLVSYDTVSDLAVLRIESDSPLPTAKLGRSASLRVGEWVVALGSPLHLQNSVTAGIVSCVDRKAVELGLAGARTDYIQTDAAINKGNSGGPLVNLFGEVVGISAMKAVAADGVSFAIPVDTAVDVMRQLKEHGRVIRPYVGIKMLQLNKHNAAQFRKRDPAFPRVEAGILVPGVHPGSPAERAGLRPGDCIIGFGEPPCRPDQATTTALIRALGEHIGRPLALRLARPGGKVETLSVVAQEAGDGLH